MRSTFIVDDDNYRKLARLSIEKYGSAKKMSRTLNDILKDALGIGMKDDMFGAWKSERGLSTDGLREEGEPH
jgi:hypothetical protein